MTGTDLRDSNSSKDVKTLEPSPPVTITDPMEEVPDLLAEEGENLHPGSVLGDGRPVQDDTDSAFGDGDSGAYVLCELEDRFNTKSFQELIYCLHSF